MSQDKLVTAAGPHMAAALKEAEIARSAGEVPVGAVIVRGDKLVARAHNRVERDNDPSAHAELLAIREACGVSGAARLPDCDLYVTLEPCPMCAQAISFARIRNLYFGAFDPKGGGVDHGPRIFQQPSCHHAPEVYGGIAEHEAAALLKDFFTERR